MHKWFHQVEHIVVEMLVLIVLLIEAYKFLRFIGR
jgi:hypothetical protein